MYSYKHARCRVKAVLENILSSNFISLLLLLLLLLISILFAQHDFFPVCLEGTLCSNSEAKYQDILLMLNNTYLSCKNKPALFNMKF